MKRIPHFNLLSIFFLLVVLSNSSCSSEDLLSEIIAQNEEPPPTGEEPTDPTPPISTNALDINTTPCDYTLATLTANETLKVSCQLDLEGQTIALPANVILEYDGGEIINGALTFSGGKIDGDLLNQDLEVSGTVVLMDPTFTFHPERWDIVQGKTNSDRAQLNNNNLENLMFFSNGLGAHTFVIDEFDAYFEISKVTSTTTNQNFYPSLEAINIPSDFHLKMSDNTVLRVFPNNSSGVLLAAREVSNSKISGGTLYGDRNEHDYSTTNAGEGGNHLLHVHASTDVVVDGVKFINGSAGGLVINSLRFTFQPDYLPTKNVTIRNCIFENNRRMATAITDGYDLIIENNSYLNTGLENANSDGGVVGYALNIEANRTRDANGEFVFYEKVQNVTIRNNIERGSRIGGMTVSIGENITIENNDMENKIVYSATSGTKIRNNKFTASEKSSNTPAILAAGKGETVFDNEISGNTITGYGVAIAIYEGKLNIFDNNIIDCNNGMQLKELTDTEIYNNNISSSLSSSRGISMQLTHGNNVNIFENSISVQANHLYFVALNEENEYASNVVTIHDNNFSSEASAVFSRTSGVLFEQNTLEGQVQLVNAKNIDIKSTESHGISLTSTNTEIAITLNKIDISASGKYECVKISSSTDPLEVLLDGNTCL